MATFNIIKILFAYCVVIAAVDCHLNLYMNAQEVMKLLGVSAELYYIRNGHVNNFAQNFVVPIAANVKEIFFTWQSLAGRSLPYTINVITSNPKVLPRPTLNISESGEISVDSQSFSVTMKCSEMQENEIEIILKIEVTLNRNTNNVTEILLRRKKLCIIKDEYDNIVETIYNDSIEPQKGLITVLIGSTLAITVVTLLIFIACCAQETSMQRVHCHSIKNLSFQRLQGKPPSEPPSVYMSSSSMNAQIQMTCTRLKKPYQEPEKLYRKIGDLTVQRCRIRLSSLLQEGTFGRVYRGSYNENQEVLVKTVAQHANQVQVSLLLQESMSLYGASNVGILSVLGVSIEDHATPFLVYPAPNNTKNLKLFLLEPACSRSITSIQIVTMANQISLALGHLHNYGVIHKDIACRNCVIDDQLGVKLTDSALSRDLFPGDYNCLGDSENRPIKWMALESLKKKTFSEASDTWSFGVLLWELCTFAKQPYAEVDAFEMEHYLTDGYRLAQPYNCPDELFAVMAYCWALMPSERPTFAQLQSCILDFYSQITKYV